MRLSVVSAPVITVDMPEQAEQKQKLVAKLNTIYGTTQKEEKSNRFTLHRKVHSSMPQLEGIAKHKGHERKPSADVLQLKVSS